MHKFGSNIQSGKFAWLTAPGSHARPHYDVVVAENTYFVALPSLGSIVPGWMLLVPRRPVVTLSLLNKEERAALVSLKADIMRRLEVYGKPIFVFEHGGNAGSLVSCGVDQAHLHVVPLGFDLVEAARRHDFGWRPCVGIGELSDFETGGQEYLFVENASSSFIGFPKTPTSQWFRQLIAGESGELEWDYKKTPNLEQVATTAADLTSPSTSKKVASNRI